MYVLSSSPAKAASIQIYTILTLFYVQNSMSTILVRFVSLRKRVEFRRISRLNRQKLFVGDFLEDFAPNRNTFGVCPGWESTLFVDGAEKYFKYASARTYTTIHMHLVAFFSGHEIDLNSLFI